jgi:DNA polymerase-3 subunit delta'
MLSSAIYSEGFIGHAPVIERLHELITRRRIPHAVLFSGPDGVGKSLAGRWLAAAYLCKEGGCGKCTDCTRVHKGIHPDLHQVQAEEGRRDIVIRQIRELTSAIGTKPFEASGKAALLDEVDRMNEESQNAFLKTLEEPPPQTLIILITAAPENLLPTIRSRCQRFAFTALSQEEMERFAGKSVQVQPDFPIRLAEGSPGRWIRMNECNVGAARKRFMDYLRSPRIPSPVRAAGDLMDWAAEGEESKQDLRRKLKLSFSIAAGIIRDMIVLMEGGELRHLLNIDLEEALRESVSIYDLHGLYFAANALVDATEDVAGYVDPGLAVDNVFRVIREIRK